MQRMKDYKDANHLQKTILSFLASKVNDEGMSSIPSPSSFRYKRRNKIILKVLIQTMMDI